MGKSIRSKRMKKLRSLKREKLMPREQILLEQRAAIIRVVEGEEVDESALPVLPEDANAPKRFAHTKDGKPPVVHTLKSRYGHLAHTNVSITKFNTLEALKERYDKKPAGQQVKVKKEEDDEELPSAAAAAEQKLPTTMAQRRSRGRDRTSRSVTGSSAAEPAAAAAAAESVKVESGDEMADGEEVVDLEDDSVRYGEFGKPAHVRQSVKRSKLARKRSKSKSKNGFLSWHNLAASS